jgi:hypothetical protein
MKFSGRFKSRLEVNVGIGGCVALITTLLCEAVSLSTMPFIQPRSKARPVRTHARSSARIPERSSDVCRSAFRHHC